MDRQLEFICLATEAPAAIDEREPKQRHRFFSPGPCACHQIRFPVDQTASRQSPTVPRLALREFFGERQFTLRFLLDGDVATVSIDEVALD